MVFGGCCRQYRRVELESSKHVLFMPNVHAAVPPRMGQLEWFEVIAQTPFPGPGNRYQTKVTKFGARVYWSSLAFDHHGHVQLLQKQLDYFAG